MTQIITEYHLSEKEELYQTWKHYEELLNEELIAPSHLYNAVKINELRKKANSYRRSWEEYCKSSMINLKG
tara:strand:+ start:39 stop:251 length:213 start_codon:yes stop_codon:yes gene_type:complete